MFTYARPPMHRSRPAGSRRDEELSPTGRLLELQRTAGNRAVTALVQREEDEAQPAAAAQGSLPDVQIEATEEHEKGAGEEKEDGEGRPARVAAPVLPATGNGRKIRVKDLGVAVDDPQLPETDVRPSGHEDRIGVSNAQVAWTNPGNKSVSPFGSESFNPGYSGLTWQENAGIIELDFTLDVDCPWGVASGGKTDVPSGSDAVVTMDTHQGIASDLTPALVEKSWRAPRTNYWSKAICERHEKFHSTDDRAWVQGAGKRVLADYLANQTIDVADEERNVCGPIEAKLAPIMTEAMKNLQRANTAFYKGGATSYLSYAGEERAFGDGKVPYQDLAAAVKKRGEELSKA